MKKIPWLFSTLRSQKRQAGQLLALEILRALSLLLFAQLTARWLDAVFLRGAQGKETAPVLLVLFFVMAASAILRRGRARVLARLSARLRLRVRQALHARLLTPRADADAPILTLALEATDALDLWFSRVLPILLALICVLPLLLLAACLRDPLTAGLMLLTLPIAPFLLYLIGRVTKDASKLQWQRMEELSEAFSELLRTLPTLKLFGQASAQRTDVAQGSDAFSHAALRVLQLSFVSAFALELITTLSIAIIAVSIGLRLLYGQLAFETAFFLLLLAPEFFQPLRQAGAAFHSGMTAATAEELLRKALGTGGEAALSPDAPEALREEADRLPRQSLPARNLGTDALSRDICAAPSAAPSSPRPQTSAPTVAASSLSYTYPQHPLPVLKERFLMLTAETMTALTGPSGCGKSTLLRVLAGLAAPYAGSIAIAGRELSSLSDEERARLISYVPQEPQIYPGTLAENIALFAPVSPERLQAARRLAVLDESGGVPWPASQRLGEGGRALSEGQRKRLGLARAFYQDRPFVLLDEPTAALDAQTASRVRAALRQHLAGKTVLIATHDAALLALADRRIAWEVSP